MRETFSEHSRVQGILDFEAALARAEARVGMIPAGAADVIKGHCVAEHFDFRELAAAASSAGNIAIPIVSALRRRIAKDDAKAADFLHWGATSQDAIDTGLVLQIRRGAALLDADAGRLADVLAKLAERHAATPILGRTWLQAAVPITFGLTAAGWLGAVERSQEQLAQAARAASVIQLGGAAGSMAALGDRGPDVARALAKELALDLPSLPWHAHRDRIVNLGAALGALIGTLGKMARDISLLMQSEIAEVSEPSAPGRGTSSSMPQKSNPVACAAALAAATRAPGLVATLFAGMPQEHQRGLGGWQAEWDTLPELFLLAADALRQMLGAAEGLVVDTARMRANIDATKGVVMAESVAMALTPAIGRERANALVEAASRRALDQRIHLRAALAGDGEVSRHLTPQMLDQLFSLETHIKAAEGLVTRTLAVAKVRLPSAALGPGKPDTTGGPVRV
jgi:3-carboxy-cis,cis-muconate cycloisomerase